MKAIFLSLLVIILGVPSCSVTNGERGNGNIQSKEYNIEDYSAIQLSGSAKMVYRQSASERPYLQIEIDENLHQYLEPVVENGCLRLERTKNISPTKYVIVTNSKALRNASLSGSGNLTLDSDIESDQLNISVSGSGKIIAGNVRCKDLSSKVVGSGSLQIGSLYSESLGVSISGSGKMKAAGSATETNTKISGSGSVDIQELVSEKATASVSGSGNVSLNVTKELDAKVSGSGGVYYAGNPEHKNVSTSGSGKVKAAK